MSKADGAFLTLGELATELNLPQHILRYWERRFPQLKPLQRSGTRRSYRPADVEIARQLPHLLYLVRKRFCTGKCWSARLDLGGLRLIKITTSVLENDKQF